MPLETALTTHDEFQALALDYFENWYKHNPVDASWLGIHAYDDMLGDFPFVGDAERAHAVAALLLPFIRDLIPGATPLHGIEASTPGTGKTLLADTLVLPSIGRPPAAMTASASEEEMRKRLTAKRRLRARITLKVTRGQTTKTKRMRLLLRAPRAR